GRRPAPAGAAGQRAAAEPAPRGPRPAHRQPARMARAPARPAAARRRRQRRPGADRPDGRAARLSVRSARRRGRGARQRARRARTRRDDRAAAARDPRRPAVVPQHDDCVRNAARRHAVGTGDRILLSRRRGHGRAAAAKRRAGRGRIRRMTAQGLFGFLGRQARWALPAGVFVGIALPGLAATLRPLLTAAVIGTLTAALLRLDWDRLAGAAKRPALPAAIAAWQLVLSPLLVWLGTALAGLPPDLRLVLVLQAAAPPIGSAAVFALILGLDGILAVIGTVTTTLLLPFTLTPLVALLLPQAGVEVDLAAFFARVTLLVAVPFALAWTLRRVLGAARIARHDELLAGLNVVLL